MMLSNLTKLFAYISTHQNGFLPYRFTCTNLAIILQFISEQLDRRGKIDVIYSNLNSQQLSTFGRAVHLLFTIILVMFFL